MSSWAASSPDCRPVAPASRRILSAHAWLLVETTEGAYMPVESTIIEIVWWSDPNFDKYFVYDYAFENVFEALDYLETDFDWWL